MGKRISKATRSAAESLVASLTLDNVAEVSGRIYRSSVDPFTAEGDLKRAVKKVLQAKGVANLTQAEVALLDKCYRVQREGKPLSTPITPWYASSQYYTDQKESK